MEGGSYSASGDDRGRNSSVQIVNNNELGTNFMLSTNTSNHADDQLNYDCSAGTRKGKYYKEIGLHLANDQDEPETEGERLRRENYQKVKSQNRRCLGQFCWTQSACITSILTAQTFITAGTSHSLKRC